MKKSTVTLTKGVTPVPVSVPAVPKDTQLMLWCNDVHNSTEELALLRNFISTIYMHPNLLGHEDFLGLRKFLENLGITFKCDNPEICIPIEPSSNTSMTSIYPELPKTSVPFLFSFGFISGMIFDPVKRCVTIQKFSLMPSMKLILNRLLQRLHESPGFLYSHSYLFMYQFLISFGVDPGSVSLYVESKQPMTTCRPVPPLQKFKCEVKAKSNLR